MGRKPQVNYWSSRHGYYTNVNGKQHRLAEGPDDAPHGPTFLRALEAFKQILELGTVATAKDASPVQAVLERYLTHIKPKLAPRTFTLRLCGIQPFVGILGDVSIRDLTHGMVEEFLAKMRAVPRQAGPKGRMVKWGDAAVGTFFESQ
jgi:hypothetical protein